MIAISSLSKATQFTGTHSSQGLSTAKKAPEMQCYFNQNGNVPSILKH